MKYNNNNIYYNIYYYYYIIIDKIYHSKSTKFFIT